ncbi:MAG: SemiSWEET transporter [Alphaproteobacteria bacterium]|jgi:MtN3 and saliva related transmembrane protein
MSQTLIAVIGLTAAAITTLCWVPQALHIIRTRDTTALSLPAYAALATGIGLWLVYGLMIGDIPLILSNMVTFALIVVIIALKLKYG